MEENKDAAVFVILKNVLITTKTGKKFPISHSDWKLIPETLDVLRKYAKEGYMIIILDNADEVIDGFMSKVLYNKRINDICIVLQKALKAYKFEPDGKYRVNFDICNKKGDYNYIPNVGMILENAVEFELDYSKCVVVGNKQLAFNSNLKFIDLL